MTLLRTIRIKFKRLGRGVRNLITWFPTIWRYNPNHFDSTLAVLIKSIREQRDYLIKNKDHPFAKINRYSNLHEMNEVIEIYDMTYGNEETYLRKELDSIEKKYGKWNFHTDNITNTLERKWEINYDPQKLIHVEEQYNKALDRGHAKIKKQKKQMWLNINKNIENWGF